MPDLAFVLVEDAAAPDPERVIATGKRLGLAMKCTSRGEPQVYEIEGGGTLMAMVMPAPHPDVATMAFGPMSPEPDVARAAKAHVVVTALELAGAPRARDTRMALLAATIVENTRAVGVMLGHGVVFHRPDVWVAMAGAALDEGVLPAEVAVDVTVARETGDRMSFLTHGMDRYGREELYVTCPIRGKGALDFALQLVRWMLDDTTTTFATGETIGRSEDEKIEIQRVPNPRGGDRLVIRLDLDA